MLVNMVNVET